MIREEIAIKGRYHLELIERAKALPVPAVAVVHPVDAASLLGAVESARAGLINPILVGPLKRIHQAAEQLQVDINPYSIIESKHSHHSAEIACSLAQSGDVKMMMKGALHTQELLSIVMQKGYNLRTARRMSHVMVADVPTYPRLLFITDAAINIFPSLEDKQSIVQNAIDLAIALGIKTPRVALLSAVELVNPKITPTIEAAALCKMADRGQIVGGILDGPLAFDNAISSEAAEIKHIRSDVAGRADILIPPDLESANILVKQLKYLVGAQMAGLVMGARIPIILTSRSEDASSRFISAAVGKIYVDSL
ncbi:MAG: bifunctional enoyl-CoA hydratase/phosphate acetyltransferase [Candidatus Nucleicultricaceae bacterium]|jgi:phosphotransacetylase